MVAGKYDFYIEQGAYYELNLTIDDGATPTPALIDLTGYTFEGQVRKTTGDKNPVCSFQFQIQDQVTKRGQVKVFLPTSVTAAIPITADVEGVRKVVKYLADISYGPTGGEKFRLLEGPCRISAEVTK